MNAFEKRAEDYDLWFETHPWVYASECEAIRFLLPEHRRGLEIGVGTGRFASRFHIMTGVEPSDAMARIACRRGVAVCRAVAERLPFESGIFDLVLMVTTLCFVRNPLDALQEVRRVMRRDGSFILAMIDPDSAIGREYTRQKTSSPFYRDANFHSVDAALTWLRRCGLNGIRVCQTIFSDPQSITHVEPVKNGTGEGLFVVIRATIQSLTAA